MAEEVKEEKLETLTSEEDLEAVRKIIERLKKKYAEQGILLTSEEEHELRKAVLEGKIEAKLGKPEDLVRKKNKIVRLIGKIYLSFRGPLEAIVRAFKSLPFVKKLDWDLYSAAIPFTASQYLAILSVLMLATLVISAGAAFLLLTLKKLSLVQAMLLSLVPPFFVALAGLSYPSSRATARARQIDKELPFALRHLATEIRAGVSLHSALRSIAKANYGVLSQEIQRTLEEISEGATTEEALRNLGIRTKSRGLRKAVFQIIRALRTGGNLSNIMMDIASDVAFERRMQIIDFGEKLNFLGVIFVFVGIVLPVLLAVVVSIANLPIGQGLFAILKLDPIFVGVGYLVVIPTILLLMTIYIKSAEPV